MNILIVGNSQIAPLRHVHWQNPGRYLDVLGKVRFCAMRGGMGPFLAVGDHNRLIATDDRGNDNDPIFQPPDTADVPIAEYDAIVICALGFIDPGRVSSNMTVTRQGKVFEFGPKVENRLLSRSCYEQLIMDALGDQPGFRFLEHLKQRFTKPIIVQPYPLPSSAFIDDPEWVMRQLYRDPMGAHAFFHSTRDSVLAHVCTSPAELLPYPKTEWTEKYFTPAELMNPKDGVHMNVVYAEMVLKRLCDRLSAPGTSPPVDHSAGSSHL